MIQPILIDKQSSFLGDDCALCKQPLAPGDEAVICPEDATRHHAHCWRAHGNRCTAYGCRGQGALAPRAAERYRPRRNLQTIEIVDRPRRRSKVLALPTSQWGCAQSCLLLTIALAIILLSIGCFGLWAIADYVMTEILNWQYRSSLSSSLLTWFLQTSGRLV